MGGNPQSPTPGRGLGTRQRATRQGTVVLSTLGAVDAFRSAQDLHSELRRQGHRIGLSTVYRHLQALTEQGEVDAARNDSGEVIYRRCGADTHHHHLVCRTCGRTVEIAGEAVETWMDSVASSAGFTDVAHTVEIFGTCASCTRDTAGGG